MAEATSAEPAAEPEPYRGLSSTEAASRLQAVGPNAIGRVTDEPLWKEILDSLREPLQLLLLVVGVLYAVLGQIRDAAIIFGVIVTVAAVEAWTEHRAGRALAALSRLSAPKALAWRDGSLRALAPEELVPGDLILLAAGSRVPADVRLVEADQLLVDESLVTGESQPVEHATGEGERGELKAGTYVVRGRAVAEVTATGAQSTLGRIAALVRDSAGEKTPLQRHMAELARGLLVAAVAVSVIVPAIGFLRGQPLREMLLTGLTLAFATIPEELPILVVIVLGLGSLRLAKRGAIVRRLIAAETLGATTLVLTDKTGTLTENRMTLTSVIPAAELLDGQGSAQDANRVTELARLASEPPSGDGSRFVDPMDLAVWRAAGPGPEPDLRLTFDSERRLASGLSRDDGRALLASKGAPEAVGARAAGWRSARGVKPLDDRARERLLRAAERLAAEGGRVLAVASRLVPTLELDRDHLERDLVLEGLLVFSDPLRRKVPAAVRQLRDAGVTVTMVTGDQPATAAAIGRAAGIPGQVYTGPETASWPPEQIAERAAEGAIFARVRPEDKLRIVNAASAAGQVVAVTGDGVNDAPALHAAAIGVAMGRGSDVAREAADLVITDDNFATLADAAAEGRRLYENLRKAVRYYLAVKLALILVTLIAALTGGPLPFAPVQIVILELFMDLGASLAFVQQAPEADEMKRPPRNPRARFLDRSMLAGIVAGGLTLALLSGAAFGLALPQLGVDSARTLALVAWLVGHAALGIVMGWERRPVAVRDLLANRAMLGWAGTAVLFSVALATLPPFAALLHAGPVPAQSWLLAASAGLVLPLWLELGKRWRS